MTVKTTGRGSIVLAGECPSEDAERLLQRLLATPSATVDLRSCETLHPAVLQVLLAAAPKLRLPPAETELGRRLRALLPAAIG